MLEHLPDDGAALENIARMTGKYFLAASVQGRMRKFERHVGHVRNYRRGELIQKIQHTGLEVVKTVEWRFPFYSPRLRDSLEVSDGKGTSGYYGRARKLAASALYAPFSAELIEKRGEYSRFSSEKVRSPDKDVAMSSVRPSSGSRRLDPALSVQATHARMSFR